MPLTILTSAGVAFAKAVKDKELYMAWGRGGAWGSAQTLTNQAFTSGTLNVGQTNITGVLVRSLDNLTTYALGTDYTANTGAGTITKVGSGITGNVNVSFVPLPPAASAADTVLVDEIGRRKISTKNYVVADAGGTITVGGNKYSVSVTPTNKLYVAAIFAIDEAPDEVIREYAVFTETVVSDSVEPGESYVAVGDVVSPGFMVVINRVAPIFRNAATQQELAALLSF